MAYAVGVPQHRNAAYRLDLSDEFLGAPGNDEVDILIEGEEFAYFLAGFEEGEPVLRQACLFSGAGDHRREGLIALSRLASAFEHDGVSALHRERCHLHKRIRAAFEDHCDEADRAADPSEHKAFVKKACLKDFPDRIGHVEEVPNTRQHLLQLYFIEEESLQEGSCKAFCASLFHVPPIGLEYRLAMNIELSRNMLKRCILDLCPRGEERRGGLCGALEPFLHIHASNYIKNRNNQPEGAQRWMHRLFARVLVY